MFREQNSVIQVDVGIEVYSNWIADIGKCKFAPGNNPFVGQIWFDLLICAEMFHILYSIVYISWLFSLFVYLKDL